ncbi:hypothetical protein LMG24235_08149 [Paraburkholderia sabiae]|nr:hypothetical protein LMG24235_08149 [Paraburkholderia sabiae]
MCGIGLHSAEFYKGYSAHKTMPRHQSGNA